MWFYYHSAALATTLWLTGHQLGLQSDPDNRVGHFSTRYWVPKVENFKCRCENVIGAPKLVRCTFVPDWHCKVHYTVKKSQPRTIKHQNLIYGEWSKKFLVVCQVHTAGIGQIECNRLATRLFIKLQPQCVCKPWGKLVDKLTLKFNCQYYPGWIWGFLR